MYGGCKSSVPAGNYESIGPGSSTIASPIDRDVRMLFWDTAGIALHALMLKKPHQFSQTVLQHCVPASVSAPVTLSAPLFSLIGQLTHA